ncbi:bifunctional 2-C-methyl-D-erythritol 4-phosphate cytidylyltransferase/2-C-methyl-D-erythritol 2,4-cyclodiphosphate synthase [Sphingomonas sp. ABOLE]|uniref:bifunctional 2-C-methyl-D-erythritol 4-phosphate cytidylyltransferase/2-C-methyl-D-erythritol 2,4-cyclodiphosphate synthase n=1 Tax=Sphingomonas sp. ABOLE TaxID=1985878 RepID=UPI000F7E76E3|nr:bifunctional 2-C-methyl-D-erythritol 4-phosphate cytidylyltransferase/2-C-methyl-D-erythritol 2,4-cyclodiphosphate synthase [Sphingomonas sp. ABOLE]RSV40464.1 bifunctional 2-C-methyl-D-erythritol 4-phosphate cytidylyltransferase/2-C-methyl-D-erythritol 2,4-cyclodiphosphate synthase [Sphingomonas sp. ABOLE]
MTAFRTAAILVAAGSGTRAGGSVPKQYALLGGKPLLAYAHHALSSHPKIGAVLTVIGEGQEALLEAALGTTPFVTGGATRRESVRNGLEALLAGGFTHVLIHDAARPFLPARVIDDLLTSLDAEGGAIPALPVADTLVRGEGARIGDTVPRDDLYRVQTPQAFSFDAILDAHRRWPAEQEATDDAQMLRAFGGQVALVPGDPMLEKITHPADFAAAETRLAAAMRVRTATGYDVHRFAEGEALWLGGVRIPHSKGLSGHSDADVALHAITDALLGTIGAGDIGMHFPPSDPQWRGAASARFLEHAASLVAAEGGILDFIDVTLICEAPKIGPHREAIRASIAAILGLDPGQVSVKATTTERLGFTGRGEGMAAQAVATVRVPARN